MDFTFSDDQDSIRELAYQIFTDRASDEFLLAFSRTGETYDETLWQTLAEQGLLGVAIPEACGGTGFGLMELCLVLEEQGRRVAPVPLYASLVLGGLPITAFGTEAQQQRYLPALADGSAKFSAAIAELAMNPAVATAVTATREGSDWRLSGRKAVVPDGAVANFILVPAQDEQGRQTVFIVDTSAPGVTVQTVEIGLSGGRAAHLDLDNVTVGEDAVLGAPGQGADILEWLEQRANIGHCALQVGVTEEAMKRTAAFLSERKQFGVPLGTFQALAMRMADCYIDIECLRLTTYQAVSLLDSQQCALTEVQIAKIWAGDTGHRVSYATQHVHGGTGIDRDYPLWRYCLWLRHNEMTLGCSAAQVAALGQRLAAGEGLFS